MQRYEHSGAVPLLGLLLTLAAALAVSVLGPIYTYLVVWIPFIYINLFISIGFGLLIGVAVGFAARLGKIRNTVVAGLLGVLAVIPAYYTSWMFDLPARAGLENGAILILPSEIFAYVKWLYENGSWGLFGMNAVTGPLLVGVWLIEAGIIVVLSGGAAARLVGEQPFCELCRTWIHKEEGVCRLSLIDVDPAMLAHLTEGRIDPLADIPIADSSEAQYLRLDLACCPTCGECNVLTVHVAKNVVDNKGKVSTETQALVENLMISEADVARVRGAGRQRTADERRRLGTAWADAGAEGGRSARTG